MTPDRRKVESLIDDMMQAHSDMLDYPWYDNTYKMLKADVQIAREALIASLLPPEGERICEKCGLRITPHRCGDNHEF